MDVVHVCGSLLGLDRDFGGRNGNCSWFGSESLGLLLTHSLDPWPSRPSRGHHGMQFRDAFYDCIERQGESFIPGTAVPGPCRKHREEYEKACKSSWVSGGDWMPWSASVWHAASSPPRHTICSYTALSHAHQVKHFDGLHDQRTQLALKLQESINHSRARGSLAGREQQS